MKKLIPFFAFAALMLSFSPAFAQQQAYWHANDYYSVELTGAGNGFVVADIYLESLSQKGVSSITLQIPYTKVQIYKLAQGGGYWYPPCTGDVCPYYGQTYYDPSFLEYTTETLADSTLLRFNLTYPLVNNSQVNIYIVFSTPKIAKETFQGFDFSFKTIQDSNALTRYVGASVTVPENMELKGKPKFNIDYSPSELAMSTSSAKDFVGMIRSPSYYGGYQYTAQNLLPGESFTVTGLYGENLFLLYFYEIAIGIVGLIFFLTVFYLFIYGRVRRMFARRSGVEEIRRRPGFSFGRAFVTGIFSGFIFVFAFFTLTFLSSLLQGGYYYYQPILTILFFMLDAIILLISLFGLPYYLFSRYSRSEGITSGIISIVSALIFLVAISILLPSSQPIYFTEILNSAAGTLKS